LNFTESDIEEVGNALDFDLGTSTGVRNVYSMEVFPLSWISILAISAATSTAQPPAAENVSAYINRLHAAFVEIFNDDKMIEKGVLGVSRLEISLLDRHGRNFHQTAMLSHKFWTAVSIHGNRGKKLDSRTMEMRYHRWTMPMLPSELDPKSSMQATFIAKAAHEISKGKMGPITRIYDGWRIESRPIVLERSVCLRCHTGVKKGEAVALMLYVAKRKP